MNDSSASMKMEIRRDITGSILDIGEAVRVLKPGGTIHLWDTDIDSAYPEPFVVDLEIVTDRFSVHTSYGIVKKDAQDADTILRDLHDLGLKRCHCEKEQGQFLIVCEKASEE